jgi:hypothetical protein
MKPILEALRRSSLAAGKALAAAWEVSLKWLAIPVNLCLAVLGLVFLTSFAAWAIGDRFEEALLYFPDAKGSLRGEVREVPHSRSAEARAELIASELLLGPKTASLSPAFPPGIRVESVLYRKGRLFVDISPSAALGDPKDPESRGIKAGLAAMERSLKAALPGARRLTLTIGGTEPYVVGMKAEGGPGIKKTGK